MDSEQLLNHRAQLELALNVLVAAVLGALVGLERELAKKPAGLRTHMLICSAAALFVHLGKLIAYAVPQGSDEINIDPTRIVHSIVIGISFIGAGVIFQNERSGNVKHLTTATSIWFIAGVGIAVGMELFLLAALSTLLVLGVNALLGLLEKKNLLEGT